MFLVRFVHYIPSSIRETPSKGTLLNPTSGSLKRDLIERVYIPKRPLILTLTYICQKMCGPRPPPPAPRFGSLVSTKASSNWGRRGRGDSWDPAITTTTKIAIVLLRILIIVVVIIIITVWRY